MANVTSVNPWILDSTGAVTTMLMRVASIRWVGPTTAGHKATITDKNGKVVWDTITGNVSANNMPEESTPTFFAPGTNWDGLTVSVLGSGKLYITFA